jgi:phosphoglycolate phosphatase
MKHLKEVIGHKKHVIWDWNGTLLNDVEMVVAAISTVMDEYGLTPPTVREYSQIFGFPVSEYYLKLGFDFSITPFEEISRKFVANYMENIVTCRLHSGAEELLASLKTSGIRQSILSAGHEDSLKYHLKHFKIDSFFDHVFGLKDHNAKSKVQRGEELIAAAGYLLEETLLIGDTDHDLEVGKTLGIEVLLLADGHQTFDRLSKLHDWVIEDRFAVPPGK